DPAGHGRAGGRAGQPLAAGRGPGGRAAGDALRSAARASRGLSSRLPLRGAGAAGGAPLSGVAAGRSRRRGGGLKPGMRITAVALLALLLLSACAGVAPQPEEPPVPYPAELRDRLVDLALREWQAFGSGITDYRGPDRVELQTPLAESDPQVFHLVQGYW